MDLPPNYYHALLGNGIDAVLVGPTGSMVGECIHGPDRCYWYKADRYYPRGIPAPPSADRITTRPGYRPDPDDPWYELAPLARCWYEVLRPSGPAPVPLVHSAQRFDPERAVLSNDVEYTGVGLTVTSFLHEQMPVLVEQYESAAPVRLRFACAPGPWVPSLDEPDPATDVHVYPDPVPVIRYRIGDTPVVLTMVVQPGPERWGADGATVWVESGGTAITRHVILVDDREERGPPAGLDERAATLLAAVRAKGFEGLLREHTSAWQIFHRSAAWMDIPDPDLARTYAFTRYQLKAIQHPVDGALPVNNLRATWSSHVFWDAGFMHLLLLQAGHLREGDLACGFFEHLAPRAARNAADAGARGLKYEWEVTHDGTPAYGVHRHLTHQVHNNAMFSLMCWHQYRYGGDVRVLRRLYPLMRGVAEFYLTGVVQDGARLRMLTGIDELSVPVALDATTLAGVVRSLCNTAAAAGLLGVDAAFASECGAVADRLMQQFAALTIDGILRGTERGELSWGVLPACSLMETYPTDDPLVTRTARAFVAANANPRHGIVGNGTPGRGPADGFCWVAGWLAYVLARAGLRDEAWQVLLPLRPAVSSCGGLPERVFDDGTWNMQYFTTAQAAVGLGLHALVAHARGDDIHITAPPWTAPGAFRNLHLNGLAISGEWDRQAVRTCTLRNVTPAHLDRTIHLGSRSIRVSLAPAQDAVL